MDNLLDNWHELPLPKPENDKELMQSILLMFTKAGSFHKVSVNMKGEGAYFGKQVLVTLIEYPISYPIDFEVAYDQHTLSVFNPNHNGYWVQEYFSVNDSTEQGKYALQVWKQFLINEFLLGEF